MSSIIRQYGQEPEQVLKEYRYNIVSYDDGEVKDYGKIINMTIESIKQKNDCSGEDLRPVLNEIVLWKVNRIVDVDDEVLLKTFQYCNNVKGPEDVLSNEQQIKEIVEKLLSAKKGIRIAMASTILHFFNPNAFPIIDTRAYRAIHCDEPSNKIPQGKSEAVDCYIKYIKDCLEIWKNGCEGVRSLNECGKGFEYIDRYLYQCDKRAKNRI